MAEGWLGCQQSHQADAFVRVSGPLLEAIGVAREEDGTSGASFAACGVAPMTLPLLRVKGTVGSGASSAATEDMMMAQTVGLPISPEQAELLVAAGEQAPHGRGEATVLDTSVRDARRINSDQVAFGNPEWAPLIDQLAQAAKKGLGVIQGVKAELHNLLVYSKGGHFARHRDSEKVPGMFGTLVASLPSAHRGGDLLLRHKGTQERFETASDAPTQILWCAFYADVEHELMPVESGHRVVLVYNLVGTSLNLGNKVIPSTPPMVSAGALALRQVASSDKWGPGCLKVAHMLDHKYSEESLVGWGDLKGKDAAVVSALRSSGAYDLQLVSITFTEEGDDGGDEDDGYSGYGSPEITDCTYEFHGWHLDEHHPAAGGDDLPEPIAAVYKDDTEIDPELFLQQGYFENRDPDDEEHEGPTGNEGCPMSRWYYAAAVVIRPKKLRFAAAGPEACAALVTDALEGDARALCGFETPQGLYDACMVEGSLDSSDDASSSFPPKVVNEFLVALGHPSLSEESAKSFLRSMKGSALSTCMSPGLGAVLAKHGKDSGSTWVGAELLRLLTEAAGYSEVKAATAFDLLTILFSSTTEEWRERMREEAAEAMVSSLGSAVSNPAALTALDLLDLRILPPQQMYGVSNEQHEKDKREHSRKVAEAKLSHPANQASKTIIAAVSSLMMSPSETQVSHPVFGALCMRAGALIAKNPTRFDPLRAVPSALVSLGFPPSPPPPPPPSDEEHQQQTTTETATTTSFSPQQHSPRDAFVSTLLDAAVAHVASDKTKHDCDTQTVKFALKCAIEAGAVDQWAPLSSHFAAGALAAASAALSAPSSTYRRAISGAAWAQCLRDITVPLLEASKPEPPSYSSDAVPYPMFFSRHQQQHKQKDQQQPRHATKAAIELFGLASAIDDATYGDDGGGGHQGATSGLVARITEQWPLKPARIALCKDLWSGLQGGDKDRACRRAAACLVQSCIDEVEPLAAEVHPLDGCHAKTLSEAPLQSEPGALGAFAQSHNNMEPSIELYGREYTHSGAETLRLERLAAQTRMFSVERVSSMAAYVKGVVRVTKGAAWQAADKAKAKRDVEVAEAEASKKLLKELRGLVPATDQAAQHHQAKRAKLEQPKEHRQEPPRPLDDEVIIIDD